MTKIISKNLPSTIPNDTPLFTSGGNISNSTNDVNALLKRCESQAKFYKTSAIIAGVLGVAAATALVAYDVFLLIATFPLAIYNRRCPDYFYAFQWLNELSDYLKIASLVTFLPTLFMLPLMPALSLYKKHKDYTECIKNLNDSKFVEYANTLKIKISTNEIINNMLCIRNAQRLAQKS